MKKIWFAIWEEYLPFLQHEIDTISIKLQEKGYSKDEANKKAEKQIKRIFALILVVLIPLSIVIVYEMLKNFWAFN